MQQGDLIQRPVDLIELSSKDGRCKCRIVNAHLDGGRYAELYFFKEWLGAYKFKVESAETIRIKDPDIVLGDFNCVQGKLKGQIDYLRGLRTTHDVEQPFATLERPLGETLEEFEGTLVGNGTSLYAVHAAIILNIGPLLRLSKHGYTIVSPAGDHVVTSLRGQAWVDLVMVRQGFHRANDTFNEFDRRFPNNVETDAPADK